MKNIFIVGSGKLANAILSADLTIPSCKIIRWESKYQGLNEKTIIVHAGSGRQLEECFDLCSRTKSVLIELSTGLGTEKKEPDFPLIICPNASILVLKVLSMMNKSGNYFKNYKISISESHQSTKKTDPGTAHAFANALEVPKNNIISIRDSATQINQIGIPEKYIARHAWHKIHIKDENDEVTIETKVLGHQSYANGVKKIIESVLKNNLQNKKYTVLELIDTDMI